MGGDDLKKVQAGDPLRVPAKAWNAFIDAARAHQGGRPGMGGRWHLHPPETGVVLVKNISGSDRDRFDVLGVEGVILTPSANLDAFKNDVLLTGDTPAEADHLGRFVVLLQPIANGEIGRACVDGVCPARVDVQDADDRYADVKDADAASLLGGPSGAASILWKESGTGVKWAVVRIGEDPVPIGVIVMWSGSVASIPAGWSLCDGTDGTPDLTGRFVMGIDPDGRDDEKDVGDTGGYRFHGLSENGHPDHKDHSHYRVPVGNTHTAGATTTGYETYVSGPMTIGHEGTIVFRHAGEEPGFNAWPVNDPRTGSPWDPAEEAHSYLDTDNRPRYYVLAFIMHTG